MGGRRDSCESVGANYFPRTQEITLDGPVLWLLVALTVGQRAAVRPRAGAARHRRAGGRVVALDGAIVDRQRRRPTPATSARRSSVRDRDAAARRRRAAARQPERAAARRSRASTPATCSPARSGCRRRSIRSAAASSPSGTSCERRVEALPGVSGVAFADGRPPDDVGNFNNFDLEESPTPPGQSQPVTPWVAVTPEYFRVLGLTLLEGRLLDERDALRRISKSSSSIGRGRSGSFRTGGRRQAVPRRGCTTCPWTTVVGVVSEVKYAGLDKPDQGTVYSPMAGAVSHCSDISLLRTRADPLTVLPAVRQVVRELDPSAAVFQRRDDRRAGRAVAPAAAVAVPAGRRLCAGRARPVGRRHLRRDGVLRPAAHQGHQHPPGARRQPARCAAADRRSGHEGRGGGSRRRLADRARG